MKKFIFGLLILVLCLTSVSCIKQPSEHLPNNIENSTENTENQPGTDVVDPVTEDVTETPPEPEKVTVTLYFPDNDALYLHAEEREIFVEKTTDSAVTDVLTAILLELFKGPETEGLSPSLIGDDLINSVEVSDDGTCTVDFKSDFASLNAGGTARESFVFGSIVNSLCTLEGIERVKFNIDGNRNAEFGGHFTLEAPVSPQWELVKK